MEAARKAEEKAKEKDKEKAKKAVEAAGKKLEANQGKHDAENEKLTLMTKQLVSMFAS